MSRTRYTSLGKPKAKPKNDTTPAATSSGKPNATKDQLFLQRYAKWYDANKMPKKYEGLGAIGALQKYRKTNDRRRRK